MESLYNEILHCRKCSLYKTRNHPICGEGHPKAPIFIIGEAPGREEDKVGRPFIGRSGQLLDKILAACGFSRDEHVFISNIVRCRPPNNRVPTDKEAQACIPYLHRQIEIVDPQILITLGSTAIKRIMQDHAIKISSVRGKWLSMEGRRIMPVFHPAALLRNPSLKKTTWEDFKEIIFTYREDINPKHHSDYA